MLLFGAHSSSHFWPELKCGASNFSSLGWQICRRGWHWVFSASDQCLAYLCKSPVSHPPGSCRDMEPTSGTSWAHPGPTCSSVPQQKPEPSHPASRAPWQGCAQGSEAVAAGARGNKCPESFVATANSWSTQWDKEGGAAKAGICSCQLRVPLLSPLQLPLLLLAPSSRVVVKYGAQRKLQWCFSSWCRLALPKQQELYQEKE